MFTQIFQSFAHIQLQAHSRSELPLQGRLDSSLNHLSNSCFVLLLPMQPVTSGTTEIAWGSYSSSSCATLVSPREDSKAHTNRDFDEISLLDSDLGMNSRLLAMWFELFTLSRSVKTNGLPQFCTRWTSTSHDYCTKCCQTLNEISNRDRDADFEFRQCRDVFSSRQRCRSVLQMVRTTLHLRRTFVQIALRTVPW